MEHRLEEVKDDQERREHDKRRERIERQYHEKLAEIDRIVKAAGERSTREQLERHRAAQVQNSIRIISRHWREQKAAIRKMWRQRVSMP